MAENLSLGFPGGLQLITPRNTHVLWAHFFRGPMSLHLKLIVVGAPAPVPWMPAVPRRGLCSHWRWLYRLHSSLISCLWGATRDGCFVWVLEGLASWGWRYSKIFQDWTVFFFSKVWGEVGLELFFLFQMLLFFFVDLHSVFGRNTCFW